MGAVAITALGLVIVRWAAELWLDIVNERYVRAHARQVPEAFVGVIDEATYQKSVAYTLAKSRFGNVAAAFDTLVLLAVLFSGVLPWAFGQWSRQAGESAWSMAGFLFATGIALAVPGLPFAWYGQFRLEARFGFNTTTTKTWVLDRLKGMLLAALLGYPLLVLVLKVVGWAGANWWLWAWAMVVTFQCLVMLVAPVLIMPLFNKFTPITDEALRERLFRLAERTGFRTRSIQMMDGSRRSRHANAFFTGFGRFRKIVLFDTLLQQLGEVELEAVLAHEIGHYKKHHIVKLLAVSVVSLLVAFAAIAWLAQQTWFFEAFGFTPRAGFGAAAIAPALLLFSLLAGSVTFWASPLINNWSRRYEFEADRFARQAMSEPHSLIGALRKLTEKNLSNLTPHPIYSRFHYSHPTLVERERALRGPAGELALASSSDDAH